MGKRQIHGLVNSKKQVQFTNDFTNFEGKDMLSYATICETKYKFTLP